MIDTTSSAIIRHHEVYSVSDDHSSDAKRCIHDLGCKVTVSLCNCDKTVDKALNSNDNRTEEIPYEFICPITQEIMKHPLMTRYGQAYERDAIITFLTEHSQTCPMTRRKLYLHDLVRHRALEYRMEIWMKSHESVALKIQENDNDDDDDDDHNIVLTCKKSSLITVEHKNVEPIHNNSEKTKYQRNKGFIRSLLHRTTKRQ